MRPLLCLLFLIIAGTMNAVQVSDLSSPMVHDPVMIKQGDTYYLFFTGWGIKVMSSTDMKEWKLEKPVLDRKSVV